MANPDSGNMPSELANKPAMPKRRASAAQPPVTEKTASWPGLPGKGGPDRSNGIKRLKTYTKSEGLG